jgi:hypothetical protein
MLLARIIAGVIGALALIKALPLWAGLYFRRDPIALSISGMLLLVGLFAFWFALFGNDADERVHMKRTLLAGACRRRRLLLAGFVGPIILRPDSNQGPLLGIFITGPAGFVLGGLGGFVWSRMAGP